MTSNLAEPARVEPNDVTQFNVKFSTLFGGAGDEVGEGVAVDYPSGDIVIVGHTTSTDFPLMNAHNSTYGLPRDGFVSKFSSNGDLLWSTYLGSGLQETWARDVAIDSNHDIIVIGETKESDFPTTTGAINQTYGGGNGDIFVTKFSSDGVLLWSTYIGGSGFETVGRFNLTQSDEILLTGRTSSPDFPTLNANDTTFNGNYDAFIMKISPSGGLVYSSYFGGSDSDRGDAIMWNGGNNGFFVFGGTSSADFPIQNAYNSTYSGFSDLFVSSFNETGHLLWSTYFGGSSLDAAIQLGRGDDGGVYIAGFTQSANFPTTPGAFNQTYGDSYDGFLTKFSFNGDLIWSTYVGGSSNDLVNALYIAENTVVVAGYSQSSDFPLINAIDSTIDGGQDAFVSVFNSDGTLSTSTFFGSTLSDRVYDVVLTGRSIYLTGNGGLDGFPTTNGNPYPDGNAFLTVLSVPIPLQTSTSNPIGTASNSASSPTSPISSPEPSSIANTSSQSLPPSSPASSLPSDVSPVGSRNLLHLMVLTLLIPISRRIRIPKKR